MVCGFPFHYGYIKLRLNTGEWDQVIGGPLEANNKSITSAPIPFRDILQWSHEIIEENVLLIQERNEGMVYNCKDLFLEGQV